jgi:hypothetical protein
LARRILSIQRFAELNAFQDRYLIRANYQCAGMSNRDCSSFRDRQAQRGNIRAFACQRRFFYIWIGDFEWNLQPLKQFASIYRTGTQNKLLADLLCFQSLLLEILTLGSKKYIMLYVYMA